MKINKYSFSGGGGDGTLEQHKKFGGNVEKDIPCQYLKFFEQKIKNQIILMKIIILKVH